MLKLRRVDIEHREEVYEKLKMYVEEVVQRLSPQLIILFGSFARGDINEGSDIDLLVVADFHEGFLDRIGTLLKLNRFKIPVEPVGYTFEEFNEMKMKGNLFIVEVLSMGKMLYTAHQHSEGST